MSGRKLRAATGEALTAAVQHRQALHLLGKGMDALETRSAQLENRVRLLTVACGALLGVVGVGGLVAVLVTLGVR